MNYNDYAQSDTYIGKYMRMMEAQETPLAYDFWCACWTLGVALGRKYPILRPRAPVYMNSYIILVADSGITRKSTAVSAATRVVRKFIEQHDPQAALLDGRVTSASLLRTMVETNNGGHDASVSLSISELAATIGRTGSSHDLPILLTDMYDSPDFRRGGTKTFGSYEVRNVYLSLLAASTPAWLLRAVSPNIVEGGFTSRCIFVVSDKRKRKIAWPEEQTDDRQAEDVVHELVRRKLDLDASGQQGISATSTAKRRFSEWYNARRSHTDVYRSSFDSRADAHTLRVAGYLAVSDRSYTIESRHITQAIDLVENARENGVRLFAGGDSDTTPRHVKAFDRLRHVLAEAGREGIAQGKITLAMGHYADAALTVKILEAMHEMDMVQRTLVPTTQKGGRTKTLWRATKLIYSKQSQDIVQYLADPSTLGVRDD